MKQLVHKANARGMTKAGWLTSFHSFSFGHYYNPLRMEFGLLRVLNDDLIGAGKGFGAHPHENMEIISIPLQGSLCHEDNLGNKEVITRDDVQIMSAGSGVMHSEFNASEKEEGAFLQIWISPHTEDIEPRYEKKTFDREGCKNTYQLLISPDKRNNSLQIFQNAWISRIDLDEGEEIKYQAYDTTNGIFIFVIEGECEINGEVLSLRDAISMDATEIGAIKTNKNSELLVIEVPLRE